MPLFVAERGTGRAERWIREDRDVVVWTLTRLEVLSALARRRRAEPGAARQLVAARREFLSAWERWSEVAVVEVVRRHAERVVESHPIRAGDALQIGAAIVVAEDDPGALEFVTLDADQATVAEREGFRVLTLE